jgi:hypothetical protein
MPTPDLHEYSLQVYAPERDVDLCAAAEMFRLLGRAFQAQSERLESEPPFQILARDHLVWGGNWGGDPVRLKASAPAMRAIADVSQSGSRRVLELLTPSAAKLVSKLQHHLCENDITVGFTLDEEFGAESANLGKGTEDFDVGPPPVIEKQCNIHGHVMAVSVARPAAWLKIRGQARQVRVSLSLQQAQRIAGWISKPEAGRIRLTGRGKWLLPDHQLISFRADSNVEPFGLKESKDAEEMRQRIRSVLVDPYGDEAFEKAVSESIAARGED